MKTRVLTAKEIKSVEHVIDAKGKILGQVATEAAKLLMGKHKVLNSYNLVNADKVKILNGGKVVVTGNRLKSKVYRRHSGFPGGEREETMEKLIVRRPTEVLRKAIHGMLPINKLRDDRMRKLTILAGD